MKRLYLLRHAKSSWEDPGLADHDRPLAPRGRRAAKLMAEHLKREAVTPSTVLCSSSRRTRETLERITPMIGEVEEVRIERALYAASEAELLERLRELSDELESAMLIGHNPGIQELALRLARPSPDSEKLAVKFPTAALATLGFEGSWRDLGASGADLLAFVKPRELEAVRK